MENSFKSILDQSNAVLILLPTRPYFDQVAAGLSLYLSLKGQKPVDIYCPSDMTVEFNRLVGVNKVTKELGSKNLSLRFTNYDANNIERVSYDVENGEFKLTVIPKSGFDSPKKEQIQINYSGVSADTAILIGGANGNHFPALETKDLANAKVLHIGTKDLAINQRQIMSFARPAGSVSELVYSLIKESGFSLDPDIATNLIMGIETGTNSFSSREVTAETFETVADLMKRGGRRSAQEEKAREDYPAGSIPGEIEAEKKSEEPPKDWLEPKIFKGNTVS